MARRAAVPEATGEEDASVAATVDGLVGVLRAGGHRVTVARRLLLETLVAAGGHRTADEIAAAVHARIPDIHLSTIYRNLEELERLRVVEHAHLGHGALTYHLALEPHGHLVCARCGSTTEVSDALLAPLLERASAAYGFSIDLHHLALEGICKDCAGAPAEAR